MKAIFVIAASRNLTSRAYLTHPLHDGLLGVSCKSLEVIVTIRDCVTTPDNILSCFREPNLSTLKI